MGRTMAQEDDPPLVGRTSAATASTRLPPQQPAAAGHHLPIWGAYLQALAQAPVRTKMATSLFIMGSSQIVSQRIAKGAVHDRRGLAIWASWSLILGYLNHLWQELIARHGPQRLLPKLALDHALWKVPILYIFIVYERLLRGSTLGDAWRQSVAVNPPLQWTSAKVFPIIQILNFTVVPLPLRVLYMNTTLFFWCIYLSLKMRAQ